MTDNQHRDDGRAPIMHPSPSARPEPTSAPETSARADEPNKPVPLLVQKFTKSDGTFDVDAAAKSYEHMQGLVQKTQESEKQIRTLAAQVLAEAKAAKQRGEAPAAMDRTARLAKSMALDSPDELTAALDEYFETRVRPKLDEAMDKRFAPLTESASAQSKMRQKFGDDYAANEQRLFQWIGSDSERAAEYDERLQAGDAYGGLRTAWAEFRAAGLHQSKKEERLSAEDIADRAAASLPVQRGSGRAQPAPDVAKHAQRVEQLRRQGEATGNLDDYFDAAYEGYALTYDEQMAALVRQQQR